jgi:hypothetical protein
MITHERVAPLYAPARPNTELNRQQPNTFFGEPLALPITPDVHNQCSAAEFEEKYYYINNTYREITLMKRDGLTLSIGHTNSSASKDFVIRRMIRLKSKALLSAIAALAQLGTADNAELSQIKRCLSTADCTRYSEASLMLDYVIAVDDLKAKGGTVYHQQTDLVLSLNGILQTDPHPYSTRFLNIGAFGQTSEYANQRELNVKIRLVDHSSTAGPKYLNLAGKVFKLMPQKDAPHRRITSSAAGKHTERTYEDYVQVFYSASNDTADLDNEGVGALRMTLDEAKDTMGLCEHLHDATNPGRVDAERKRELSQMAHSLEVVRGENQRDKARLEREDFSRKEELSRQLTELEVAKIATAKQKQDIEAIQAKVQMEMVLAKQTQSRLDAELQQLENVKRQLDLQKKVQDEAIERERKDFDDRAKRLRDEQESRIRNEAMYWKEFYEMRSMQRKDTSDAMRFVPGLIIGIGGVAAAWLKFSSHAKAS